MQLTLTPAPTARRGLHEIGGAAAAAGSWLLASRDTNGWWSDFRLAPGASDEWVTAYVGSVLAELGTDPGRNSAVRAWELLTGRQRRDGGWGYNALTPSDADSTLWALRLAELVGAGSSDSARRGYRRLDEHQRADGGIATYAAEGPIRAFTGIPPTTSFAGWCHSHVCVSAAAAAAGRYPGVIAYLRQTQQPDGSWQAYWWTEPAYATALAADALARRGQPSDRARLAAAVDWATRRLRRRAGSRHGGTDRAFTTAWCVYLLSRVPESIVGTDARHARDDGVEWLLGDQRPDGSWEPSAWLRVPPPDVLDPESWSQWVEGGRVERAVVVDHRAAFTTATALLALRAAAARCDRLRTAA